LAGLTCLALVAFAFRARKDLWAEPLQRPENCDEILDSSRVYGNYEKVIKSLSASKDLAAIPSAFASLMIFLRLGIVLVSPIAILF
jgi:hypothetical protein